MSTTSTDSPDSDRVGSLSPDQSPSANDFPLSISTGSAEDASTLPQRQLTVFHSTTDLIKGLSASMSDIPSYFPGAPVRLQRPFSKAGLTYRLSGSMDNSVQSPLIEKGFVPPPPVSFNAAWDAGTSVDDDLNGQSENRSPSTGDSSDDDSQSKSSEEDSYIVEVCHRSHSLSASTSPYPDFDFEMKQKARSMSPAQRKRSLTLPRTDAYSSLCPSSRRPFTEQKTLTLPTHVLPHRVKSCDVLSTIYNRPVLGVLRTKSMDALEAQKAGSVSDLHTQSHSSRKPPPPVRRPSFPASQTLLQPQSSVHSLKSRSRSPLPKFKRVSFKKLGRESVIAQTSTPTVIQNPWLNNSIDEPDDNSMDSLVFDHQKATPTSVQVYMTGVLLIIRSCVQVTVGCKADDTRKGSIDGILSVSSMPVVQVWSPGQTLTRSDLLRSPPANFPVRCMCVTCCTDCYVDVVMFVLQDRDHGT